MAEIIKITDPYIEAMANIIRNRETPADELKKAFYRIGQWIGTRITEKYCLAYQDIITPMGCTISGTYPQNIVSYIFTTREDLNTFGKGIRASLDNASIHYMDFEGRRGFDVLNGAIRASEYPAPVPGQVVDLLIIAKSVLATGCTAMSLTTTALKDLMPNKTIIATIFYSKEGLYELRNGLPNADIFVIGEPDELDEDGMLIPGIGLLTNRINDI